MTTPETPAPASGRNWSYSFWQFWTPLDTCLMGWCCPCILFGKTQARIEDPSLANYSPINDNCLIWCGLSCCAASFLIQTKKRDELRKKYGITETHLERLLKMDEGDVKKKHNVEGSLVEDCLGAFCCRCCGLVQEEKEVVRMLEAGEQGGRQGYQKTQGMQFP
ncbi:PLAC8 family-domain-containing protein [Aspergillus cavernicola]|uniref:PLAC8 family-domain-containing protein n=1 Tax=Aspergillus cavernicola TaxID=176166 RepID=A0ABR4IG33_9EURO